MKKITIQFTGVSPLLMHSLTGVNPLHPLSKELKAITSKRSKTDEDHIKMSELDFRLGAYHDKEVGFFLPAEVVQASLKEGCKANKNGKKADTALFVMQDKIPLGHDGTNDLEEALKRPEMMDVRAVSIGQSKVMRTRPRFNRWWGEFDITLDENILTMEEFEKALEIAGSQKGLGDYRPRYGRFAAKITKVQDIATE